MESKYKVEGAARMLREYEYRTAKPKEQGIARRDAALDLVQAFMDLTKRYEFLLVKAMPDANVMGMAVWEVSVRGEAVQIRLHKEHGTMNLYRSGAHSSFTREVELEFSPGDNILRSPDGRNALDVVTEKILALAQER